MLDYYTLIWKGVSITPQFKTFISFEDLKTFATKTLNGKINVCNINKCNRLMILIAVLSVEIECKGSDK